MRGGNKWASANPVLAAGVQQRRVCDSREGFHAKDFA
jgi:hypothetical protein